jgi:hypothetical protein
MSTIHLFIREGAFRSSTQALQFPPPFLAYRHTTVYLSVYLSPPSPNPQVVHIHEQKPRHYHIPYTSPSAISIQVPFLSSSLLTYPPPPRARPGQVAGGRDGQPPRVDGPEEGNAFARCAVLTPHCHKPLLCALLYGFTRIYKAHQSALKTSHCSQH